VTGSDGAPTRRGVLGTVGVALTAGCAGLPTLSSGGDPLLATRLPDVSDDHDPLVPATLPVEVAPEHVTAHRDRTADILATVPTPLGPEEVPNGRVREDLTGAAATAREALTAAQRAPTERLTLAHLRRARRDARFAAGGWAAVDDGLRRDAFDEEIARVQSEAADVRDELRYRAEDPATAAVTYAPVERWLDRASVTSSREEDLRVLAVAVQAEAAESSRALLADAEHVPDRYLATVDGGASSVRSTLSEAAESLWTAGRSRRRALPPEREAVNPPEIDVGDTPIEGVLYDLYDGATWTNRERAGPAAAVVSATTQHARLSGFERVRSAVVDGERYTVDDERRVHEARGEAVRAHERALDDAAHAGLAHAVLAGTDSLVTRTDRDLARLSTVTRERLVRPVARYEAAAALARSVPDAVDRTLETLE